MIRRLAAILMAAGALAGPTGALGVPSLSDPALSPASWTRLSTAAATWAQNDVTGAGLGPATVQVNLAADGTATGPWTTRDEVAGPLVDGAQARVISVSDLEGRHAVRVVVTVPSGPPLALELGVLRLDRTPPAALGAVLSVTGDTATAEWTQDDGGLSGTDPGAPLAAEVNTNPAGDDAGSWVAFEDGPAPGDGARAARTTTSGLAEGTHLVRVVSRDLAGNTGARVLGAIPVDRQAPVVGEVRVTRVPAAGDRTVSLAVRVSDPQPGSGVAPGAALQVVAVPAGLVIGESPGGEGEQTVSAVLPGPGTHAIAVRVTDRAGRTGQSVPVEVTVPAAPGGAHGGGGSGGVRVVPVDPLRLLASADAPSAGTRQAWSAVLRFHSRRGVRVAARLGSARSGAAWRRMLGAAAPGLEGYATPGGVVLVGPAVVRGLDGLRAARLRPIVRGAPGGPGAGADAATRRAVPRGAPTRAEADQMVGSLAVLLHETLHVSGPAAAEDVRLHPSGRALEEGLTEAATADLLPGLVRSMALPSRLDRALRAATARYRPAYAPQVAWVRGMSERATGAGRGGRAGAAAAVWRVAAADGWGADRWTRLAAAVGVAEGELRAAIPELVATAAR